MDELKIFAKLLVSEPPSLHVLDVSAASTVEALLARVEGACAEPAANLSLVHEGAELPHESTLRACWRVESTTTE